MGMFCAACTVPAFCTCGCCLDCICQCNVCVSGEVLNPCVQWRLGARQLLLAFRLGGGARGLSCSLCPFPWHLDLTRLSSDLMPTSFTSLSPCQGRGGGCFLCILSLGDRRPSLYSPLTGLGCSISS